MFDDTNRKNALNDLIELSRPLDLIIEDLSKFSWDESEDLVMIKKIDIETVLKSVIDEKLSLKELEKWANAIESREDINFANEEIKSLIFRIANPETHGELSLGEMKSVISH